MQRLGFGPSLRPLPGQPLYAATADGEAAGPAAGSGGGAAAWGGTAGAVAVAGRRLVWLCLPVSAADQTRELLSQRDHEAALELIEGGLLQGAPWAQVAAAQAALLLLHGGLRQAALALGAVSMPLAADALWQHHCGSPAVSSPAAVKSVPPPLHPPVCRPQSAGLRRRSVAWSESAPPPSSLPSSFHSSLATLPPGRSRCAVALPACHPAAVAAGAVFGSRHCGCSLSSFQLHDARLAGPGNA